MVSKNFIYKFLIGLIILAATILWLVSVINPDLFGDFAFSYIVAGLIGGIGLVVLLVGIFSKTIGTIKKTYIWIGASLLVIALLALVSALAIPKNWILPIIAIIAAVALLLSIVVTGGKKWDQGNNQNIGYKNYYQRKEEEEKNEKDAN